MISFFTKVDPRIGVVIGSGATIKFTTINRDVGVFATEDESVAKQLDDCIRGNRGGVSRITEAAFHQLLKKKEENPFRPRWREEYSNNFRRPEDFQPPRPIASNPARHAATADQAPNLDSDAPTIEVNTTRPTATKR